MADSVARPPVVTISQGLRERAHLVIPGGCHTYAKGDDQFPEEAPIFIERGEGCRVWDVDGNQFIEYGMGLRSVTLGHAYPEVVEEVTRHLVRGSNFNRPAAIEVEVAEKLSSLIGSAERVKFAKDGSTTTTAAIRLSRAHTGRDMVGLCLDHPFFSYSDWFISTTAMNAGIPESTRALTATFKYNDIESVRSLFRENPDRIACLILEPARSEDPIDGFLLETKRLCHQNGALLVFDEMITGFRWHIGGGQQYYGVAPDLSTFGKAMANGFSVSALVGRADVMDLGGIRHEKDRVFLLSTTHGAETHGLAAALATMNVYERGNVIDFLFQQGGRLKTEIDQIIDSLGIRPNVELLGKPCCLLYATRDQDMLPSQPFRTLLLQELMRRGVIAPSLVVSYSHDDSAISHTVEAFGEALYVYKKALEQGVDKYLCGRPVKPVFRRYC